MILTTFNDLLNRDIVARQISKKANIDVARIDVAEINKRSKQDTCNRYFLENYMEIEEHSDRQIATFRWIDTGYREGTDIIYIQLSRANQQKGRVGTEHQLLEEAGATSVTFKYPDTDSFTEENANDRSENSFEMVSSHSSKELDENSYFMETIMSKTWQTPHEDALDFYLKLLCQITEEHGNQQFYVQNKTNDIKMLNTGLINKYGMEIYILYKKDGSISRMVSRSELKKYGFSHEDARKNLPPTVVWQNSSELNFKATGIEDFDMQNRPMISRVIQQTINTYPEFSTEEIYQRIRVSLSVALKINQRDRRYILPAYFPDEKKICFLIPLHMTSNLDSHPELIMVVGENEDLFYEIKKVISTETAYIWAKAVNPYLNSWITTI